MTREEIINEIRYLLSELDNGEDAVSYLTQNDIKWLNENIKALEQEPTTKNDLGVDYRSLKDIKKLVERKAYDLDGVMLDAGGVIIGLYFAIANDLPSVTPQEPFINKPCVSEKVCEYDKQMVLDKIRAEILEYTEDLDIAYEICDIFNKYKAEIEEE